VSSAGDAIDSRASVIEVRVSTLKQLFNAMDPAPFRNRDLDPRAEEYIVSWSKELPRDASLVLLVHLDRAAGLPDEAEVLGDAIHQYFSERSKATRRRLKQLFRDGRVSLLIGLAFVCTALGTSQLIRSLLSPSGFNAVLHESLLIGGWVAMWRPIEVFLYDWWPIRADARLFDRLAAMPVRLSYGTGTAPDAWREDWPAASREKTESAQSRAS
jgi:hypothetical protein